MQELEHKISTYPYDDKLFQVGAQGASFAMASKYSPSKDVVLRAKLNNESQVIHDQHYSELGTV